MKVGELIAVLSVDMSQYEKDLATAQNKARTAGSVISDIFKNAVSFTVGMGLWEAIQRGFRALVGTALDFNVMMQNARIGFETMLGSAQKAQDFLDKMGKFAAATPFEYPDLLEASKRLMAMGFAAEDVLPIVKAVGDAVAGLGGGKEEINRVIYALGQMRNAGRVYAQDMMQLTSVGIPAWEILAEKMGKSVAEVRKLSEQGLIPAAQAVNILIEGMEKRFPNMMQKMQDTWMGVTSTIKDIWRMTIGAVTQSLFQGLNNWLKGVRDWATQFYAAFQQGGLMFAIQKMFGSDVATVVSVAAGALKTLWNVLVGIANFVKTHWSTLKPILLSVLITMLYFRTAAILQSVFFSIASGIEKARYALKLFAMGLRDIPSIIGKISAAIKMLTATNPIFFIITAAIAGVIIAGVLLYKNWDKVRFYGLQAWGALKIGIGYVAYAIVSYYKFILGWIPALGNAFSNMQKSLANYIAKEKSILAQRASAFNKDDSDIKSAQKLVDNQKKIADASKNAASGLSEQADATKKAGKAAQDNLQSFDEVHQILQETADASENMPEVALPGVEMPTTDTSGVLGSLSASVSAIIPTLTDAIGEGVSKLAKIFERLYQDIIVKPLDKIKTWLSDKKDPVKGAIAEFLNIIAQDIKSMPNNIEKAFQALLDTGEYLSKPENWIKPVPGLREGIAAVFKQMLKDIGIEADNFKLSLPKLPGFQGLFDFLKNMNFEGIFASFKGLPQWFNTNVWEPLKNGTNTFWLTNVQPFWKNTFETVKKFVVDNIWTPVVNWFTNSIWQPIKQGAENFWLKIIQPVWKKTFEDVKKFVIDNIWLPVVKWFDNSIWIPLKDNTQKTWNIIQKEWDKTIKAVKKVVIDDIWNPVLKWFENLWTNVKNKTVEKWTKDFKPNFEDVVKAAKQAGLNIWQTITVDIPNFVEKAADGVTKIKNEIAGKIKEPFEIAWNFISSLPAKALDWGRNLLDNIVDGINSAIGNVKNAAKNAADKIADFLGFHSPAREGPGADADKWMPNMMDMLAQGIYGNISKVRNAVAEAAGVLSGITAQPEIAFGISGSVIGYKATAQATVAPVTQPQIHLHIGTLIADDYGLKKLEQRLREIRIFEEQRLGSDKR